MKCKLLKKIRKRYRLIYKDGFHSIIDLKRQVLLNPVGWGACHSTKSMRELYIEAMIDLTIGRALHDRLREQRTQRRTGRRKRRQYLDALKHSLNQGEEHQRSVAENP